MTITIDEDIVLPDANGAIKVRNEWVLWQPGEQRGGDVVLAGVNGALPRRRFLAPTTQTLELIISGDAVVEGTAGTRAANLEANTIYLRELCEPTGADDGTRSIVVDLPSGGSLSGDVHVLNFRFGRVVENAAWALATLDISIPAGQLTVDEEPTP